MFLYLHKSQYRYTVFILLQTHDSNFIFICTPFMLKISQNYEMYDQSIDAHEP